MKYNNRANIFQAGPVLLSTMNPSVRSLMHFSPGPTRFHWVFAMDVNLWLCWDGLPLIHP